MTDIRAVSITDGLQSALDKTIAIAPKLVLFAVILFVGWLISKAIRNLVDRLLDRVGYNKAVEKAGLQRFLGTQKASSLTAKLAYYALLLFTLQLSFGVFGPNPVSTLIEGVVKWLPRAFIAVVIVVVAAAIARAVRDLAEGALGRLSYGPLLAKIAQAFIIALGVIAALNQIGVAGAVTQPVLIAALATIGGILVVGLGGGLVMPMRERWERVLTRAEQDTTRMVGDPSATSRFGQSSYSTGGADRDLDPSRAQAGQAGATASDAEHKHSV
ncbi:hypothetical protein AB0M43_17870 [Longispora sp. NPDC051575]|uniref:mechanosensitive ion channel family protein n=1 Tax=Longispora sp. NPDC051575 TaxID=3154943 RepID=UPI003413CBEB